MNILSIIGKTNTGKSTLFNKILEKKESIVSKRKNTTVRCVERQKKNILLIDTPGVILENKTDIKKTNQLIYHAIKKSDILILNLETFNIESEDFFLLDKTKNIKKKILIINKIDRIKKKEMLLNIIKKLSSYTNFLAIIPVSNITNENIKNVKNEISINSSKNKKISYESNKDEVKIKILDIVRETILNTLNKEIPYKIKIEVPQNININTNKINIHIKTDKNNYKKIIIGKNGNKIKKIIKIIERKIKKINETNIQSIKISI